MTGQAKVLNGLMERRTLEAAFQELGQTQTLDQLTEGARRLAEHGAAAVPILVSLLDTTDPQLRGGLGEVAALLEREQIVPALRGAARSRDRSDHARLTAVMILDRYLHEPVDDSLLAGLQDPESVATQSLRELSHEMARNPLVVIEYLSQLAEQPAEVVTRVLECIPRLGPDPHLVTLLRMLAQGPDLLLAQRAIDQLSRTRTPEAARALATLPPTLSPALAAHAERGLRKLQLVGVSTPEPADPSGWRAFVSPIDGTGAQVVWFVGPLKSDGQGSLLSVLCRDPDGIIASFGSADVPTEDLPPVREEGAVYVIRQAEDALPITLLAVPLDAGRQVVRSAVELGWQRHAVPPAEYRLLNEPLWELGPLAVSPDPAPTAYDPALVAALLDHSAFATWSWQDAPIYEAAGQLDRRQALLERTATVSNLLEIHFGAALVESYSRRLSGMARWLAMAGEPEPASLAAAASAHLGDLPPAQVPFLRRLAGIGLDIAVANLRNGFDWGRNLGEAA